MQDIGVSFEAPSVWSVCLLLAGVLCVIVCVVGWAVSGRKRLK